MEHGRVLHEQLYEECVTVPLLVRTPETRGGVAPGLVGLTDVAPTLAELCGLEPPAGSGPSFADALGPDVAGKDGKEREGLLLVQDQDVVGWRTARWKLIRSEGGVELYDLWEDPGETRDVAAERPAERAALEAALERRLERARQVARSLGTAADEEGDASDETLLDDEERERLRALGYLGGDEADAGGDSDRR